jgi:hypothetical protein
MTIQGASLVETFDLRVKDIDSGKIVLERVGEQVDPGNPNRDISQPGEGLKIAVEFDHGGNYLLHILGRGGQGSASLQYALRDYDVDDVREVTILLQPLVDDADGDGFPACGAAGVDCQTVACLFLDCDDSNERVNPFAEEICGNGLDDDCSARCGANPAEGDEECVDNDGDGVPAGPLDCDDNDPCRATTLAEEANLCETPESSFPPLPQACLDKLAAEGRTVAVPYCDDGVDQNCNGQDIACRVDEDCDGVSPPDDCDDTNIEIHPGAEEACDGVDNNCINGVDEGCVPCDVDGDLHAAVDSVGMDCTDDQGNPLHTSDPDDFDAGRHPGTTAESGGREGGTAITALREFCSSELDHNGRRHRDVDHDGDGSPASADGCPPESCDQDGDGFQPARCNPPSAEVDCDDENPYAFPGAPDKCGDGINQNCVSDTPCTQDADEDGYPPGVDCDDSRADRAPWAVEKCDGLDNDCDGLIDEDNPGPDGTLIPTGAGNKLCNDNNEGQCGGGGKSNEQACVPDSENCSAAGRELSGECVCSRTEPTGVRDETNRVRCGGEDLAALASPRCFRARQPDVEECDSLDHDCNGEPDDPTGIHPMVDKNTPCGTDVGNCRPGTVAGCDLSQNLPEIDLILQVLGGEEQFNPHWICEGAWLPTAEVCDGKDDDCNGVLPADERDDETDRDRFIPCGTCQAGSGRLDLRSDLLGCGDCGPGNPDVYPGAPEVCNNRDDNCTLGTDDDGASQCTGGLSCCSEQSACRDLNSDILNCGRCGNVCGAGQDCVSGRCTCIPNGRCAGCCTGDNCFTGNTVSACGTEGEPCDNCVDGRDCTLDQCNGVDCNNPIIEASANVRCRTSNGICDEEEFCDGSSRDCPSDGFKGNETVCRVSGGPCDPEERCSGTSVSCPANAWQPSTFVCRDAAGPCDLAENCTGSSAACPTNRFRPATDTCRSATGDCDLAENCTGSSAPCPADAVRSSSFVCRVASPGGCDVAENCDGVNKPCPVDAVRPNTFVCRAEEPGGCDVRERCDGVSKACPSDAVRSDSYVCRAEEPGGCDVEETCDGSTKTCPGDAVRPDTYECRAEEPGGCDVRERCDGSTKTCPIDAVRNSGYECRAEAPGGCDVREVCDGLGKSCPVDAVRPNTYECRAETGTGCDVAEDCDGSTKVCPSDGVQPDTYICRFAGSGGCGADEYCDGSTKDCPADVHAPLNTSCRAADGDCDVAEVCPGDSPDCPADGYASSGECRAVDGDCDVAESCDGSGPDCPTDGYASSGQCRAANGDCDVAESCDGSGPDCPLDVYAGSGECRADSGGGCDVAESCDGTSADCPTDGFEVVGTLCRAGDAGGCDTGAGYCHSDVNWPCTQDSDCGPCDVPEYCPGDSADCPTDGYADTDVVCRASINADCDTEETCPGDGPNCPLDAFLDDASGCEPPGGGICCAGDCIDGPAPCP